MLAIVERHDSNALRKEKTRKARRQRWAADLDLLHRIDGRPWHSIKDAIRWVLDDAFWFPNCQSPAKLRRQWDTIDLQRNRPSKGTNQKPEYEHEPVEWVSE